MRIATNMIASVASLFDHGSSLLIHASNNSITWRRLAAAARLLRRSIRCFRSMQPRMRNPSRGRSTLGCFSCCAACVCGSETFMCVFLEQHGQQAEDGHIEAKRGDRRMAEQARKADEMQHRAEQQEYRQRSHGVADKGRQQNTADHQLVERMSHWASLCSPSRIMPAWSNSQRASPSCVAGAPNAAIWPMRTASRNIASSGA